MTYFTNKTQIIGALLLSALACNANANLIENGSFETPDIDSVIGKRGSTSSTWQYYDAADVDGFSGSNIEIWNSGFLGVDAQDGGQFLELNAHPSETDNFSIFQDFDTTIGSSYNLSFYYEARRSNSEAFNASITSGTDSLISANLTDHSPGGAWNFFSGAFKAIAESTRLTFTSIFPTKGTQGNFLDDVKVSRVTEVPEINAGSAPLAAALLFGLIGLIRERASRKARRK